MSRPHPPAAVGLIGFGRWGRHIFRDLRDLGAAVHVVAPSAASRQAAVAAGAVAVHAWPDALPDLDGYVVATPTVTHAAVIDALLGRDRPIFVEKAMTNDLTAARRLVERAADRLFVMDKWRYHAGIAALAAQARSGALGDLVAIRTFRLGWGHPHRDVDAVWILLPHDLAIALEILGALPAARAAYSLTPGRPGSDLLAILGDGPGGPIVTCEVSANHPVSRRAVTVIGTRATAQLADTYDDRIEIVAGTPGAAPAAPTSVSISDTLPLRAELAAFLAHLRGGPPPRSSAREGLLVVERIHELRHLAGLP